VGTRLHPPLRRDAVRKHLADDPMQVTWLYPGPDGTFTPESLPETAFRPLAAWVDYVLEHDHEPLRAWVESAQFSFEPFVCDDAAEGAAREAPPATRVGHPRRGAEGEGQRRERGGGAGGRRIRRGRRGAAQRAAPAARRAGGAVPRGRRRTRRGGAPEVVA